MIRFISIGYGTAMLGLEKLTDFGHYSPIINRGAREAWIRETKVSRNIGQYIFLSK